MNNLYSLFFVISLLISGCNYKVNEDNRLTQTINSLDMNVYSNKGDKIYTINSPISSYNKIKHIFELGKTTIYVYKNKEIKYTIRSDESKLSNNNNILELNGNVQLKTILQDDDILYADNFVWNINDSKYFLKGNVIFENKNIILSSNKAILSSDNIIEFFNPVKYIIKNENNEKNYEINSENAFYNVITKSVSFESKNKQVRSKLYF